MAMTERRRVLVNGRRRNRPRRRLSAKQIAAGFGGKRRQSALRSHRTRSRPATNPKRRRGHKVKSHRRRRKNVTEILSMHLPAALNPARKKRRNKMAATRKRRRSRKVSAHSTHRHRRARTNPVHHRRRARRFNVKHRRRSRRNPSITGGAENMLTQGAEILAGWAGSKLLTNFALGASNTGVMGYAGNAAAGIALSLGAKAMKAPRVAKNILIGTFVGIVQRIVVDYTPLGKYVNLQLAGMGIRGDAGMGILLPQNFVQPAIFDDAGAVQPSGWAYHPAVTGKGTAGMGASTYQVSTYGRR